MAALITRASVYASGSRPACFMSRSIHCVIFSSCSDVSEFVSYHPLNEQGFDCTGSGVDLSVCVIEEA